MFKALLLFAVIGVVFAVPGLYAENEWSNLENSLKEQGIISDGQAPVAPAGGGANTTTVNLPGGGTRTTTTGADGSRTVTETGRTKEPSTLTTTFSPDGNVATQNMQYSNGDVRTVDNRGSERTDTTTSPNGTTVKSTFSADGSSTTDISGGDTEPTHITRTPNGPLTETVTHADGTKTETVTHGNGERTTTQINAQGNKTSKIDNHSDGTHERTEYDANGVATRTTTFSAGGYPRPTGTVEYVYDSQGRKVRDVIKGANGDIIEVIYYNPDGSVNRRSRNPNAQPTRDGFGDALRTPGFSSSRRFQRGDLRQGQDTTQQIEHDQPNID